MLFHIRHLSKIQADYTDKPDFAAGRPGSHHGLAGSIALDVRDSLDPDRSWHAEDWGETNLLQVLV